MKPFIVAVLTLLFVAFAVGQSRPKTTPRKKPHAVKRVPFDPKRDPKADLAAAVKKATAAHKRIVLDVGGEWCIWCLYMDKFFAAHRTLSTARDKNYIWVKINYSEENENKDFLSAYPEVAGYPHLFVLDADGKLLQSQDTSVFERGEVYSSDAILKFLNDWAPTSK